MPKFLPPKNTVSVGTGIAGTVIGYRSSGSVTLSRGPPAPIDKVTAAVTYRVLIGRGGASRTNSTKSGRTRTVLISDRDRLDAKSVDRVQTIASFAVRGLPALSSTPQATVIFTALAAARTVSVGNTPLIKLDDSTDGIDAGVGT